MFIGHFGLSFAAKSIRQQPSLGTMFLAAQFIDLLWPFFLVMGLETIAVDPGNTVFTPINFISYPYSHSLVAVLIWAVLFGGVYYLIKRDRRSALLLGALVVSHWILDLIVHRPDLPISLSENTKVGLGLWNNRMATMIIEGLIFAAGVWLYSTTTKAKNKTGNYALWGLVLFFVAIYFMNAYGDPPPDAKTIGYVAFAQWLFIVWAYWVDRHRMPQRKVL